MRNRSIEEMLRGWLDEPVETPHRFRENYEGNVEALWIYTEEDEGEEHMVEVGVLEFTPDSFIYSWYQDTFWYEKMSEPLLDEDGEPYITDYDQDWQVERIEISRRAVLRFLSDYLSGKLVREKVPMRYRAHTGEMVTYMKDGWVRVPGRPAKRRLPPRGRKELSRWIASMGQEMLSWASTGYEHEGPPDID